MKNTLWIIGGAVAGYLIGRMVAQKKEEKKSNAAGLTGSARQTCSEKCAALGFGVLSNNPCYCKQGK